MSVIRFVDKFTDETKINTELNEDHPPVLAFNYRFPYNFGTMANAAFAKCRWQAHRSLTSVTQVEQLDDDRIMMIRRHDSLDKPEFLWEKLIINRNTKEIESSHLAANYDATPYLLDRTTISEAGEQASSSRMDVFDIQQNATFKVEHFRNNVIQLLRSVKFNQWRSEEQASE